MWEEEERVRCGAKIMSFSSVTLPGGAQFGGTGDTFNDSSCESPTPFQNGTRQVSLPVNQPLQLYHYSILI